jgi:predicted nucleic acid-binding protein
MLLLDTGPIYSSIDRSDPDHQVVVDILRSAPRPHLVVQPVLVEVDYWLRKFLDVSAFGALISDVAEGRYRVECLDSIDLQRAAELEAAYADADLGFVDAALVAVAERMDVTTILTFDRRHFSAIRPGHRAHFDLIP